MSNDPIIQETAQDITRFYRGQSMAGTFRLGDALILEAVPLDRVRVGDVVVFDGADLEGNPKQIVHRVFAILPHGLVTRGDNNPWLDQGLVTADNLVGRVTHVRRGGRLRPVPGGRRGLWRARLFRAGQNWRRRGKRLVTWLGRWPYRLLRRSGIVPHLWKPSITRLLLRAEGSTTVKYISNGRTVAQWWPDSGRFWLRRPYDLILSRPKRSDMAVNPARVLKKSLRQTKANRKDAKDARKGQGKP